MAKTNLLGAFSTGFFGGLGSRAIKEDDTNEDIRKQEAIIGLQSKAQKELEEIRAERDLEKAKELQKLQDARALALYRAKASVDREARAANLSALGGPASVTTDPIVQPEDPTMVDPTIDPMSDLGATDNTIPMPTETIQDDDTDLEGNTSSEDVMGGTGTPTAASPKGWSDQEWAVISSSKDPAAEAGRMLRAKQKQGGAGLSAQDTNAIAKIDEATSGIRTSVPMLFELGNIIQTTPESGVMYPLKGMVGKVIPKFSDEAVKSEVWDSLDTKLNIAQMKDLKPVSNSDLAEGLKALPNAGGKQAANIQKFNRLAAASAASQALPEGYRKWASVYGSINAKSEKGETVDNMLTESINKVAKAVDVSGRKETLTLNEYEAINKLIGLTMNVKLAKTPEERNGYIEQIKQVQDKLNEGAE